MSLLSIAGRRLAATVSLVALSATLFAAAPVLAQEAPDVLVKRVSQEVVQTIKSDPLVQAGNEARIREVIESKLAPNFDFMRMTSLAMGRNWKSATPEQQKQLADEFRTLLVRTYSGALNKFRDETIETKPLRINAGETEVTVRTVVPRPSGSGVPIDYSMEQTPTGWKAYDIIVGGVSLVTNYRDEFAAQIKSGGIDGLIRTLADKNKGPAPTKPPATK